MYGYITWNKWNFFSPLTSAREACRFAWLLAHMGGVQDGANQSEQVELFAPFDFCA